MRLLACLLPLFALFAVGIMLGAAYLSDGEAGAVHAMRDPSGNEADAPAAPQLKPGATVCQGVLHRPDPNAPRTFPAVYTQQREVMGLTVVAGPAVSTKAFDIAAQTIHAMFDNNTLIGALQQQGAYIVIAEPGQGVLDLPEFGCLQQQFGEEFFSHVCGVADRADYPVATVNELDLIGDKSGPCRGLNVLYHELGHLVQNWSISPADYYDIKVLYQEALDAGKYHNQYAATNPNEYFAEATQSYFLYDEPDGGKNRAWLKQYDPKLFAILDRVYNE
jgi:hypothetical protein